MHKLFWKFFLSFWAALLLFTVVTVISASYFVEHKRNTREQVSPHEQMQQWGDAAQSAVDSGGIEQLRHWLNKMDRREIVPLYLVDAETADILGRSVPEHLDRRLDRAAERANRPPRRRHHPVWVRLPDGSAYRLIADFRGVTLARVLARPRVMVVPVILAALISGFVCFLLVRYLTRPLAHLHHAAEAYGRGELHTRVSPALSGRRDEIADLAHAFDRMAGQLEGLLQSHKQLLRDVSHELRSPLARLQVALGLAQKKADSVAGSELARIELETERLDALIGQLLSLARLEAREQALQSEEVDLKALVMKIMEDAQFEARTRQRDVKLVESDAVYIQGDEVLLHSAVENIVRNAIRHTNEGTIVEITLKRNSDSPGYVSLQVRDHGPGVPDALLPRLFEPFVRAEEDRDRATGGYGLGLAIAQRVVQLHEGTITASNGEDDGLVVVVRLKSTF